MIRDDLLTDELRGWQELHGVLDPISLDRWEKPGAAGDWSVKDVVAHIACWHAEGASQLERIRMGDRMEWPEVETFNREAHERTRDLTVDETRVMSAAARHRLREELAQVAPVALTPKILATIGECAEEHYAEHLPDLRAFASGTPGTA